MNTHYFSNVRPSLPNMNTPIYVFDRVELNHSPITLPHDKDETLQSVTDTWTYIAGNKSIADLKDELRPGDTLTLSFINPWTLWVHEDFWLDGANPDWNMPDTQHEEVWSKSPIDNRNILTRHWSGYDFYFDQPWAALCEENCEPQWDDELGYYVPIWLGDDETEES